ncbi:hypothetical protein BD410DRAFT_783327 [Rickenella mellea]|uniref:Uncharacterized protein n=1 Tax=Rickenella mellea TaxID=50990 RepID=A0A4Y7QIE3_9AGAM|nr:hypothetical protein BD410DRAFT_783327 [Rickenella mellea]
MIAIIPSTGYSGPSFPAVTATEAATMITTMPSTSAIVSPFPAPIATEPPTSSATITSMPSSVLSGSSFPPTAASRRPNGHPNSRPNGRPNGRPNQHPHNRESVQPSFRFARRHTFASGLGSDHAFTRELIFHNRRSLNIQPQINSSGDIDGITLTGLNGQSQPVTLSMGCIEALAFPDLLFRNAKREDLTMLSFSFWVLVMSMASIVYDSIPHLVVAFLGNCAGLAWFISQVTVTAKFSKIFYSAITINACGGIELRPLGVFKKQQVSIIGTTINASFFPVFMFVTYKIFQIYRHQSFQRVGATNKVYNTYTLALGFSVCLHLSGFLVISTSVIWLNEMLSGVIRKYLHHRALEIALFLLGILGNIPWLLMGTNIIFRERKKLMLAFIVHCVAVSILWATTVTNRLFQYTIWTWPFFAGLSILSFIFLVAITVLGVICRYNFGNGLKHYITVLEVLEEAKFTPGVFSHDLEKSDIADPQHGVRAAALSEMHSDVLSGIPIRVSTTSTAASCDESNADLHSPTQYRAGSVEPTPTDLVGLPRSPSRFSNNSHSTGVSGQSWSSSLWSRGVAAIFRSVTPSSYRAPRLSTVIPSGRFSLSSSVTTETSSTTLPTPHASQSVPDPLFSTSTSERGPGTTVPLSLSKPLPSHPR